MTPTTGSNGSAASPTAATGKGRDIWLKLRVNESERAHLAAAASAAGLSTANYLRERLGLELEGRSRIGHAKKGKKKQPPEIAAVNSQSHPEESAVPKTLLGLPIVLDDTLEMGEIKLGPVEKFENHTAEAPVLGRVVAVDPGLGDEGVTLVIDQHADGSMTVVDEGPALSFADLVRKRRGK